MHGAALFLVLAASFGGGRVDVSRGRTFGYDWRAQTIRDGFARELHQAKGTPAISSTRSLVLVGQGEGDLVALDSENGRELHRYRHGVSFAGPVSTVRVGAAELALVTDQYGKLMAFEPDLKVKRWEVELGRPSRAPIQQVDDDLLIRIESGQIIRLSAVDGDVVWRSGRDGSSEMAIFGHAGVLVHGGTVFTGFDDGVVGAYALDDGKALWEARLPTKRRARFRDVDATPVMAGGHLFVAAFEGGVAALDPQTGQRLWGHKLEGITSINPYGPVVVAVSSGGVLIGIDAEDLKIRYRSRFPAGAVGAGAIVGRALVFNAGREGLLVFDARSGRPLQAFSPNDAFYAPVAFRGEDLVVMGASGHVYAFGYEGKGLIAPSSKD